MSCRDAAAKVRIVHNVVVIQGGEVNQFDNLGPHDDVVTGWVTVLGGDEGQQRPNSFSAGLEQITGNGVRVCIAKVQI